MVKETDLQYQNHELEPVSRRLLLIAAAVLIGGSCVLVFASGGMPPLAWRLLFRTLRQFSALWQIRGTDILLPLSVLTMHALSLLIAWVSLFFCAYSIVRAWRSAPLVPQIENIQEIPAFESHRNAITSAEPETLSPPASANEHDEALFEEIEAYLTNTGSDEQKQEQITPKFMLRVAVRSHTGIEKRHMLNENRVFMQQWPASRSGNLRAPCALSIVAACKGPLGSGLEANRQIIQTISDTVIPVLASETEAEDLARHLLQGIQHAIFTYHLNSSMATDIAVSAVLILGERAYCIHLGRSRSYLWRKGEGQMQVLGYQQETDIPTTIQAIVEGADVQLLELQAGMRLLLCSDSLPAVLSEPEIAVSVQASRQSPAQVAHLLIEQALERRGKDNISVILIAVEQEEVPQIPDDDIDDILRV